MDFETNVPQSIAASILEIARPGVLARVIMGPGNGDITNGMPLLRCLAFDEEAETPNDVPGAVLPNWAAWLVCTVADNLEEPEYIQFCRDMADLLPQAHGTDALWGRVQVKYVAKMVQDAVRVLSPLAARFPGAAAEHLKIDGIVQRAARNPHQALNLLTVPLGLSHADLGDDGTLAGTVYHLLEGARGDVRNVPDILLLPLRLAAFGAGLLAGVSGRARQMALDFDWHVFLGTQHTLEVRDACAGMDWAGFAKWLVLSVQDAVNERDDVEEIIAI